MTLWVCACAAGLAVALAHRHAARLEMRVPPHQASTGRAPTDRAPTDRAPTDRAPTDRAPTDPGRRRRLLVSALAGLGVQLFVGGPAGLVAGLAASAGAWVVLARVEPAAVRREREVVRRQLPHVVALLASALRGGAPPESAVHLVCEALPGPAADRLRGLAARLALGADPVRAWGDLAGSDVELAALGRVMSRAHQSGAPVVAAVERLAEGLARADRAEVEDRARAVGVKAAVPLGLCLLPAFVLLGIVPLVAGLVTSLGW